MVWRRVCVRSTTTLRELHGILQVAMGWEGIHLYQFVVRTVRYGSWETGARPANASLADLKLRLGARFVYEYDLNIPWEHEVRLEIRLPVDPKARYPICTGGSGACPLEDSGGPARWMSSQDEALGSGMLDDLAAAGALFGEAARTRSFAMFEDPERFEDLQDVVERLEACQDRLGRAFDRRGVNARLRRDDHLDLMHQQM